MTEENNFKNLCNLATRVMNMPDGALSLKSRKRKLQAARASVCYIARTEDDIHRSIIAKVLNRDRAVTYHYEKRHKQDYATCLVYRNTFLKIYKAYKDIDGAKEIFVDKDFMKSYLLKHGVKEILNPDVLLEVKSGEVHCIIKTSYFEFSKQIKNIESALNNYHYTVKII